MQLTKRLILAALAVLHLSTATQAANLTLTAWRTNAKEADIHGFPMAANYCVRHDALYPTRQAGEGQGKQLATCAEGTVLHRPAALHPEAGSAANGPTEAFFDKTWQLPDAEQVQ